MLFTLLILSFGARTGRAQDATKTAPVPFVNGPGSTLSQAARPAIPRASKLPYGLELMARPDLLPTLRDTKCVQDSSYDRAGGNADFGNFVRSDGNRAVLADIRGPGCIYRFWSANAVGQLKIYFDGETTPRIDCPIQDLFQGKVAPFAAPLVGHKSGGWYSFFPLPFQKACRIEVTDPGALYYHVQYQLFPDGTPVKTFAVTLDQAEQKALDAVMDQWRHLGSDPKPTAPASRDLGGAITCAPGQTRTLATLNGPAQIQRFRIVQTPINRFTLRQILLRVYWDGAAKPAIEAPLSEFFGVEPDGIKFAALMTAASDDSWVCYWPMPFAKSARLEIVNAGASQPALIQWNLTYSPQTVRPSNVGYFHAQWRRQTMKAGEPFHILQAKGRGLYVGEHTFMQGDRGIWFMEGDEKIAVDNEPFPSIYGTGTEDFYTGGWYFDEGTFSLANHGCVLKRDDQSRVAAYRYQLQDCVPFQKNLTVDIEHGAANDYPGADYACVAYWYQDAPMHDSPALDLARLTPPIYRTVNALEAETLTWRGVPPEFRDDRAFAFEASGGKLAALDGNRKDGAHPAFVLDVKTDDIYNLTFSQLYQPGSATRAYWSLDGDANSDALAFDLDDPALPGRTGRWNTSTLVRLKPGPHTFALTDSGGKPLYLDYALLDPSPKARGVIEAESLLEKAEVAAPAEIKRNDDAGECSGYSNLEWRPGKDGATLKLPLALPADGDFSLELGVVNGSHSPALSAQLDGADIGTGGVLATYTAPAGNSVVRRIALGRTTGLKAGAHMLALTYHAAPGDAPSPVLALDYVRVWKSLYPDSLEAEDLRVLSVKDGAAQPQPMGGFGDGWSGDSQLWFTGQRAGAEIALELPVARAGRYQLAAYYTAARDYALIQVLVDGRALGAVTDCYADSVRAKGRIPLGALTLTAGPHTLVFRAVGKNLRSSGYLIGVDALALEPEK